MFFVFFSIAQLFYVFKFMHLYVTVNIVFELLQYWAKTSVSKFNVSKGVPERIRKYGIVSKERFDKLEY